MKAHLAEARRPPARINGSPNKNPSQAGCPISEGETFRSQSVRDSPAGIARAINRRIIQSRARWFTIPLTLPDEVCSSNRPSIRPVLA
ncbi:MAG: hypothetical protein ACREIH_06155, partial [Nitrospiraceae bacterium]